MKGIIDSIHHFFVLKIHFKKGLSHELYVLLSNVISCTPFSPLIVIIVVNSPLVSFECFLITGRVLLSEIL